MKIYWVLLFTANARVLEVNAKKVEEGFLLVFYQMCPHCAPKFSMGQ